MRLIALTALGLVVLARVTCAAPPPFADDAFVDGDWELLTFSFKNVTGGAQPGGVVQASQQPGGNPGTMRQVTDTVPISPSATESSQTYGIHLHRGKMYDPAQGAIATIDYSEDARLLEGFGDGQSTGLAVRQGGNVYIAQVGATPDPTWVRREHKGYLGTSLVLLTPDGFVSGPPLDVSANGAPIQFGFFRANSTSPGAGGYTIVAAIDNWRVQVNPFCTADPECDDTDLCSTDRCVGGKCTHDLLDCGDGDGCTTDSCVDGVCTHGPLDCIDPDACTTDGCANGACTHTPVDCNDGKECTVDTCLDGCQHRPAASFAVVQARATQLLDLLKRRDCLEETLRAKLARKLKAKIAKARSRLARADAATRAALISKLISKGDQLIGAAKTALATAAQRDQVSATCKEALDVVLADLQQCVAGLPRS